MRPENVSITYLPKKFKVVIQVTAKIMELHTKNCKILKVLSCTILKSIKIFKVKSLPYGINKKNISLVLYKSYKNQ